MVTRWIRIARLITTLVLFIVILVQSFIIRQQAAQNAQLLEAARRLRDANAELIQADAELKLAADALLMLIRR